MHRFLRDIAAGVQTLRFLTALVMSAAVTTAVAGPMALQALSYDSAAAQLGTSQFGVRPEGPQANGFRAPEPVASTPSSTASTAASTTAAPTTATTVPPTTATTAPSTTEAPTTTAAVTTTAPVIDEEEATLAPGEEVTIPTFPEPTPTTAAPQPPVVTAPTQTTVPTPTTIRPTPSLPLPASPWYETYDCQDGKAYELDEQAQPCDPAAADAQANDRTAGR